MSERSKQFRFTKKDLEALPPRAKDSAAREAEYSDTDCVGLKCLGSLGTRMVDQKS